MIRANSYCKFFIALVIAITLLVSGCIFNDSEYGEYVISGYISKETAAEIDDFIHNAYSGLPKSKEERNNFIIQIATKICNNTETIDKELIEETGFSERNIRDLDYVGQILEENFNINHNKQVFDEILRLTGSVSRYGPIIDSYNSLVVDSCTLSKRRNEESLEDFYMSTLSFGIDVILVQQKVTYRAAFAGTGIVNNKFGLASLRNICGDRCYAFALSSIHWAIRDNLEKIKDYIIEISKDGNVDINVDKIDFDALKKDLTKFLPIDNITLPIN